MIRHFVLQIRKLLNFEKDSLNLKTYIFIKLHILCGVFSFLRLTSAYEVLYYTMLNPINSQKETIIMNKKTERKNKTNQAITWPSNNEYFTIDSLIITNQHMLTDSGSDITLRVRLDDAIKKKNLVAVIGTRNCGKGRPKLAFAMTPVQQTALDKAKSEGIMLVDETKLIPFMQIKPVVVAEPEVVNVVANTITA